MVDFIVFTTNSNVQCYGVTEGHVALVEKTDFLLNRSGAKGIMF